MKTTNSLSASDGTPCCASSEPPLLVRLWLCISAPKRWRKRTKITAAGCVLVNNPANDEESDLGWRLLALSDRLWDAEFSRHNDQVDASPPITPQYDANDKSQPEPETSAQQETGGDCVSRRVQRLRAEIKHINAVLARKNRELDALHYVWCSGGCDGGVNRFMPGQLTEDVVAAAERNTARLRGWFENSKLRAKYKAERESRNVD